MKWILITMVVGFLLVTTTGAIEYYSDCVDGVLYKNATISVDGTPIEVWDNVTCSLGCSENGVECLSIKNVDSSIYLSISFALSLIIIAFAILAIKTMEGDQPLSILFILSIFVVALTLIGVLMGFNTNTQDSISEIMGQLFIGFSYILLLTVVYIMIHFVWESLIKPWKVRKEKKKEERES